MYLRNRLFFICLAFFSVWVLGAQTLYWIGGNGNFNDPQHWSMSSGGAPSNLVPSSAATAIFDDNSFQSNANISFVGESKLKAILVKTLKSLNFSGLSGAKIVISGSFEDILDNTNFNSNVNFEFINDGSNTGYISSGSSFFNSDFAVKSGKWKVNKIWLASNRSLSFVNSKVNFQNSSVQCGHLSLINCIHLDFDHAVIKALGNVNVNGSVIVSSKQSFLNKTNIEKISQPFLITIPQGKLSNNSQINSPCVNNPTIIKPTCVPGCDGKIILTLPAYTCFVLSTPTVYIVNITSSCSSAPSLTVGPGTYTISNLCGCVSDYNILIFDETGSNLMEAVLASVTQPQISNISSPVSSSSLACFGDCTGTINAVFFGGTAPYSFTITPPVGPQTFSTTGGSILQSSLCAGTLNIFAQDIAGCTSTFTRTFTSPTAINPTNSTASVSCFGAADGGYTVTPAGGTPNYTVNFNPGGSFSSNGAPVSITNLGPSVITVTVTDSKGCKATTGTTIIQPSDFTVTAAQSTISCAGSCNGVASVTVTGVSGGAGAGSYSYSWTPVTGTASSNGTLCAGGNSVVITDNILGCTVTKPFVITEIPAIAISSSIITHVVCNTSLTGAFNATLSGGTPNYTMQLVNPTATVFTLPTSTQVSISNLGANNYSINITDVSGCIKQFTFAITQPPAITLTAVTVSNTCPGGTAGAATLSPSGGNGAPFSYSWIGGNSPTTSGLAAGTYSARATDVLGCNSNTIAVVILEPPVFTYVFQTTTVNCFGQSTGALTVTPSGGSAPYSYTLVSSSTTVSNATGTFVNLAGSPSGVGIYTLIVGDSFFPGSCAQTRTLSINQPTSSVVASKVGVNATCFALCNGSLSATATGGTPSYTFTWIKPGPITVVSSTINGLCTGLYTLNVIDSRGCSAAQLTHSITQPASITIASTTSSVSCTGGQGNATNGSITTTLTGGTGPYQYTWTPAISVGSQSNAANVATLSPGTYSLVYKDANNCTQPTATFVVRSATAIAISQTNVPTTCISSCNGSYSVAVTSGGRPAFTFSFVGSSTVSNGTGNFSNVCGPYTITVRDANSCSVVATGSISTPTLYLPVFTQTAATCFGNCNARLNVTTSGGVGPNYAYTLSAVSLGTPLTATAGSAPGFTFTNLCADTYTLLIQDLGNLANCPQSFTTAVTQPINSLTSTPTAIAASCFTVCDGQLIASGTSGGTSPYTFAWISTTGTVTGQILGSRCAGNYTLRVTDNNGCVFFTNTVITQPTQITLTSSVITNVSCFGAANGAATVTPTGGPAAGTYTYAWSPSSQTTQVATGLTQQIYTVAISKDVCSRNFTLQVTQPASISLTQANAPVRCIGSCDGSATVTVVSGGVGALSYSLNSTPPIVNATGVFTGVCSGTYVAKVTDINGCTGTITVPVNTPSSAIAIGAISTRSSCATCSGGATVNVSGGTTPYSFVYTNSLGVVPALTTSITTGLCPGPYTITAIDNNTCSANAGFTIDPVILIASTINGTTTCFGSTDGSVQVTAVSGGVPGYSYSWTPSAQTTSIATNLSAGVYTVQVTDSSSPLNCVALAQATVVPSTSITLVGSTTSVSCPGLLDGSVTTTVSGGPPGTPIYTWSPSGSTSSSVTGANFGPHTVTVSIGTCTVSDTFTVGSPNPPITATLTSVSPNNCASPNNGSITVATGGGDGTTYSYAWSPNVGTTSVVTNLVPGPYQVTVTSAGCSTVFTSTLTSPLAATLTPITTQSINCFGATTGLLSYSTTAPTPSFTWSPATTSVTGTSSTTANNLSTGTYTLFMRDVNLCTNSVSILVAQAPSLTVLSSQTNVACYTGSTGVASVSVSGGTPGTPSYTFNWSNGTNATGSLSAINSLTALAAGVVYSVNIIDARSCTVSSSFTVTEPVPFTFTTNFSNITCQGAANGSIAVIANQTTGITYNWPPVPSATFAGSTNSLLTNLNAGIYTVTVSDGTCNAIGVSTVQITEPPAMTSTVTVNHNVTCFNDSNGSATFSVSGGNGSNTYTWTTSTSTTNLSGTLTVGNYTVSSTDALGCATSATFAITGPALFDATLTATNPKCTGAFDGSITTQVTGGQGAINYAWSPVGTGQSPTGLGAGFGSLVYTLTAVDDSLCTITKTITLLDPAAIVANLTFTNPVCFGNCNGLAQANPANTVGTPTITWLPSGSTGSNIGGLCSSPINNVPNIYTVNIVDGNACTNSSTFALSIPQQISASYTASPALCLVPNGSVTIVGSGGTGALTYSWLPPVSGTGSVQTGLATGTYSVLITDNNSCQNTVVIPITASNGPSATPVTNSLLCFGQCNGSASVTAISGTNITMQWLAPIVPVNTTNIASNLCAGSYTIELTDPSNNCKTYYGFQISSPPVISVSSTSSTPTCFGICDGSISVTPAGGNPGYNFSWIGPNGFTSTATAILNLCGGDYSLTVTDASSCAVTPVISIPVLNSILIQQPIAKVDNICFSDCQGSATVNVVSTTTNVLTATINWSNGQFGNTSVGMCNGIYSVQVTDTRGCSSTFSVPITSAPQISLTTSVVQPSCNLCNGSVSVTPTGGNGPTYSYTWTNGQNVPTLSNLCAGLYQIKVKDNANCSQIENIVINNSNGITGENIVKTDETCIGSCDGAATITAVGGASPISYNWINPNLSNQTNSAGPICPGNYFVQMTDLNNCIRTSSISINAATDLTVATFITPPTCTAVPADGSMSAIVSGNTGAVTYSWLPIGITSYSVANVSPGSYTLIVTDNGTGCSKTILMPVSNFTAPLYTVSTQDFDCTGPGSASIVPTGTDALTYLWSTGSTNSVVTNLTSGPITVSVTSSNGCVSVSNLSIAAIPNVEIHTQLKPLVCSNDCNGAVFIQALNGDVPYSYSLSSGSSSDLTFSLCSGSYTAIVTDQKGCADTAVVTLINPALVTYTLNRTNSSCSSLSDGSASLTLSGGLAPYTYTLVGPGTYSSTSSPFTNLLAGNYFVTFHDSLGCGTNQDTIRIVPSITVNAVASIDFSVCIGADAVVTASNSTGGSGVYWTAVGVIDTLSHSNSYSLNVIENNTLVATVTSTVPGCFDSDTVFVSVYPRPYLDAGPPSFTMSVYSSTMIGGNPTSLAGGPTLTWAPAEFLDSPEVQNPIASNTLSTTFTVSIEYGNQCMESDTVQVIIIPQVQITTGFSPNSDGKNDLWLLDYIDQFPENTVEVYNRWGDQVFFSKGYNEPWDGTYKGKPLPVGTYYYVIDLHHFAYTKPYTGPVTIFR